MVLVAQEGRDGITHLESLASQGAAEHDSGVPTPELADLALRLNPILFVC